MNGHPTSDFHVAIIGLLLPVQSCVLLSSSITGAGIAGLALAMALSNLGVSFTLYEEANEYSAVG
jgi:heterodisulfide reductase subunit A-like polyferredoxin